jgi:hypothetical protein
VDPVAGGPGFVEPGGAGARGGGSGTGCESATDVRFGGVHTHPAWASEATRAGSVCAASSYPSQWPGTAAGLRPDPFGTSVPAGSLHPYAFCSRPATRGSNGVYRDAGCSRIAACCNQPTSLPACAAGCRHPDSFGISAAARSLHPHAFCAGAKAATADGDRARSFCAGTAIASATADRPRIFCASRATGTATCGGAQPARGN